jgi:hypothetical protein
MQSTALGLIFDGSLSSLREMIASRSWAKGDIYLDYLVAGNKLSRPGLNALRERAKFGGNLTHVFIARRDRLARPNDPTDALAIENELRSLGITLVYQDKTVGPLKPGERQEIADLITGVVDFHKAGAERRDLASKVIQGQMSLARKGFSTGGRAPFGFRRALVDASGKVVRLLEDGEKVRLPGCHVAFVPGPEEEVRLALRIRELMMIYPATRVAQILNDEGIPSPDSGRTRMDNGSHAVENRHATLWEAAYSIRPADGRCTALKGQVPTNTPAGCTNSLIQRPVSTTMLTDLTLQSSH